MSAVVLANANALDELNADSRERIGVTILQDIISLPNLTVDFLIG